MCQYFRTGLVDLVRMKIYDYLVKTRQSKGDCVAKTDSVLPDNYAFSPKRFAGKAGLFRLQASRGVLHDFDGVSIGISDPHLEGAIHTGFNFAGIKPFRQPFRLKALEVW